MIILSIFVNWIVSIDTTGTGRQKKKNGTIETTSPFCLKNIALLNRKRLKSKNSYFVTINEKISNPNSDKDTPLLLRANSRNEQRVKFSETDEDIDLNKKQSADMNQFKRSMFLSIY